MLDLRRIEHTQGTNIDGSARRGRGKRDGSRGATASGVFVRNPDGNLVEFMTNLEEYAYVS